MESKLQRIGIVMPSTNWSNLNKLQLGQYAEYFAKMEFASYGFYVYTSEVDDHGVDFVAISPDESKMYEVQVKGSRCYNPVCIVKSKQKVDEKHLICFLHFIDGSMPSVFIIPSTELDKHPDIIRSREYGDGKKSAPEWGLLCSKKNLPLYQELFDPERFFENF